MKKTILCFIFCTVYLVALPQGMGWDLPESWNLNLAEHPEIFHLPPLDTQLILQQDSINDLDKSMPWRYGIEMQLDLNMWRDGLWTTLPNGAKIWRATIHSADAMNLSVNFSDFYLPPGSKLQLYNQERTDVTQTFDHDQNRINGQLGTWFVEGDIIWIEYYQPPGTPNTARLQINSVIHGYRMGRVNAIIGEGKGFNDAGACNYDVNCPVGSDFDGKKDLVKKAVALLNLGNGYLCSAALVNNTKNDKTPFLLTANHCLQNSNPALWVIRFNWVSPVPVCGTGEESGDLQTNFTISGAELRANNAKSDFALVELLDRIPESWDVAFAGWDNSDTAPIFEVGIHHPKGDIMKICRDDSGAQKVDANGTQVWLVGGGTHGSGNGWEIGTTESGSSGSPLFDENGRIIGQLYAGQSACNGLENNNDYDIYGRFGVSWNTGTTSQTRLLEWLDPINSGSATVETLQNLLNTPDFEITGDLKIYPNPAKTTITVMNNRYPHLSFQFFNVVGQRIHSGSLSNTMNTINVTNLAEGVYFLHFMDEDSNDSMTKKIIINK